MCASVGNAANWATVGHQWILHIVSWRAPSGNVHTVATPACADTEDIWGQEDTQTVSTCHKHHNKKAHQFS